jgi:hypothetical protein
MISPNVFILTIFILTKIVNLFGLIPINKKMTQNLGHSH